MRKSAPYTASLLLAACATAGGAGADMQTFSAASMGTVEEVFGCVIESVSGIEGYTIADMDRDAARLTAEGMGMDDGFTVVVQPSENDNRNVIEVTAGSSDNAQTAAQTVLADCRQGGV